MRAVTVVLLVLLVSASSFATIHHVPGDYADLQDGINASSNGDTVLVAPGTYTGPFNFNFRHITLASHYLTTGNEDLIEQTVLDGWASYTVLSIEGLEDTEAAVVGLTFRNGLGLGEWPNVTAGGLQVVNSSVTVSHCLFEDCSTLGSSNRGAGIYYGSEYGGLIENCTFRNLESYFGSAIAIANDSVDILIRDCVAYDNTCTANFNDKGVFMVTYSANVTFERCLAFNNPEASGFRIWGTSPALIDHCTSAGNGYYGVAALYSGNDITITNSILWAEGTYPGLYVDNGSFQSCLYSDVKDGSGLPWFETGCIDADPQFADPDNGDYNLTMDSPCLDAADPSGEDDPDGTPPDMGALPYYQGPPPPVTLALNLQTPTIPPNGGTVVFDATLSSTLPNVIPADGWTYIILPNGQEFGPLLLSTVYVAPGTHTLFNLQQVVPAIAPGGVYQYVASVGIYPGYVGVQDDFSFTKLGTAAQSGALNLQDWPASDWDGFQRTAGEDLSASTMLPAEFALTPVHPNPFNPTAMVEVQLPETTELSVQVVNVQGRRVATLAEGVHAAGSHRFTLGDPAWASGVYFVRASLGNGQTLTRKAMLVR